MRSLTQCPRSLSCYKLSDVHSCKKYLKIQNDVTFDLKDPISINLLGEKHVNVKLENIQIIFWGPCLIQVNLRGSQDQGWFTLDA